MFLDPGTLPSLVSGTANPACTWASSDCSPPAEAQSGQVFQLLNITPSAGITLPSSIPFKEMLKPLSCNVYELELILCV